jgi:hypothetical protein
MEFQLIHTCPGGEPLLLPELGLEIRFFGGLAQVMKGGWPDPQALAKFGDQWGVEFLGPPIQNRSQR